MNKIYIYIQMQHTPKTFVFCLVTVLLVTVQYAQHVYLEHPNAVELNVCALDERLKKYKKIQNHVKPCVTKYNNCHPKSTTKRGSEFSSMIYM